MAQVVDFKVGLPELDAKVEEAFRRRFIEGLGTKEDGASIFNLMNSYIMWKYRENWGEDV